jgi:hypothetical protein
VLIEQPLDSDWKLVTPAKPTETTRSLNRFAVIAEAGKPAELKVEEQHTLSRQHGILGTDDKTLLFFAGREITSPKVKEALEQVVRHKQKLAELAAQRLQIDQQIVQIAEEQNRIRQNMAQLDRTNDVYLKYVKKLSAQEDQIEQLRAEQKAKATEEAAQRKVLDDFVAGLDLA